MMSDRQKPSGQRRWAGPDGTGSPRIRSSFLLPRSSVSARAFTFVELLAAMVFMAIVIPAAIQGLIIANRAGVVAAHKREAAQLADRLLTEIVVTDEWQTTQRTGDFGDEWPGYRWVVDDVAWEEDSMRLLTVEVFFEAQGQEYSVRLSTLVAEEQEETET